MISVLEYVSRSHACPGETHSWMGKTQVQGARMSHTKEKPHDGKKKTREDSREKQTLIFSMLDPMRRGADMIAQRLNWVRAWSGVLYTAAEGLEPTSISGSFHPPGAA